MIKITTNQKCAIKTLRKYPNDMIMFNGRLTGGHGVKINLSTVNALRRLNLIYDGKLTELGKTIQL